MKERIIVANNLIETELLRTLAKNNIDTLGLRIKSPLELAKDSLVLSNYLNDSSFLTNEETNAIIYSFINEIKYFKNASYNDAKNINKALKDLRSLVANDNEIEKALLEDAEFIEKNKALLDVFNRYKEYRLKHNKEDDIDIKLNAINNANNFDYEYICLKEYPLYPIDYKLLEVLSNNTYKTISIKELFHKEKEINNVEFVEAYGSTNEIEYIISYILKNEISLDKCLIACGDNSYIQVIKDICDKYNIPSTFKTGLNILNSNPAKLLNALNDWDNIGYNGIDSLNSIINNDAFDLEKLIKLFNKDTNKYDLKNLINIAGSLRISTDNKINNERINNYRKLLKDKDNKYELELLDLVEILSKEFEKGIIYFLNEYTLIRNNFDKSSLLTITNNLETYINNVSNVDIYKIIPDILNKYVGKENSKEGYLHISNIGNAKETIRDYIFICGMNADSYPGNPKENYLLLDNDLKKFKDELLVPTSTNLTNLKKEDYYNLINLARYLDKKIIISYSNHNLASIKEENPSSLLFDTYEDIYGNKTTKDFKEDVIKVSFFESNLSKNEGLLKEYMNNKYFISNPIDKELETSKKALEEEWSPSALELFFNCPRRFYLRRIIKLPELEEDDPFVVASAADIGTMAHKAMEEIANKKINKKEFLNNCERIFDEFLIQRPPVFLQAGKDAKEDFLKMMDTAFDQDPKNKVITAENDYHGVHESGVKIFGLPDRVEEDKDGNKIIADYKTKRIREHEEDDINTCLQVVLYAWLCEYNGIPINKTVYRYIRLDQLVNCKYDDEIKNELNEMLNIFVDAIKNNYFEKNKKACRYCTYIDICDELDKKEGNNE